MLAIRSCTADEFFSAPNIDALLAEYAQESAIAGMPSPQVARPIYELLEQSGALTALCAFDDEAMIGFLVMVTTVNPHYGVKLTATESYFVASAHRSSGAGIRLLREAEHIAAGMGSTGLLVSAPYGGRLAEVMPRVGYRETNRVFFRSLAHV